MAGKFCYIKMLSTLHTDTPDIFKLSKYVVEVQKKITAEPEKQCEEYFKKQIAISFCL